MQIDEKIKLYKLFKKKPNCILSIKEKTTQTNKIIASKQYKGVTNTSKEIMYANKVYPFMNNQITP